MGGTPANGRYVPAANWTSFPTKIGSTDTYAPAPPAFHP